MLAPLALITFLACGEEPAPQSPDAPPATGADATPAGTKKARAPRRSTAPRLEEADRPVAAPVQEAIDRLQAEPADAVGARKALDTWIEQHPDDLDARYWRGKTELQTMAWAEAEADLQLVVAGEPDWVNPKVVLAGALAMQRRCEEALPHLDAVVAQLPDHHIGYVNRGSCRYRVGDVDGSIADATKACELGNDRACRTIPQLERRKTWKANLEQREEEAASGTGASASDAAAPPAAGTAPAEAPGSP